MNGSGPDDDWARLPAGRQQWLDPAPEPEPEPDPEPRRSGAGWLAIAVGVLTVVCLGLVAALLLGGRDTDTTQAPTGTTTRTTTPAVSATSTTGGAPAGNDSTAAAPVTTVTVTQPAPTGALRTASAGTDPRIPESGTYTGTVVQRDTRGENPDQDFFIEMVFSGQGSRVRSPDSSCAGRLIPDGFDGDARVYTEEVTEGECASGGRWTVTVHGPEAVSVTYGTPTGRYAVAGELSR